MTHVEKDDSAKHLQKSKTNMKKLEEEHTIQKNTPLYPRSDKKPIQKT